MRKIFVIAAALALVGLCGTALAQPEWDPTPRWDDLSWWGETGATPEPVPDATRSGYWWWPTDPETNVDDQELWGNRGLVYALYEPVEEPAPPPPPPPPPPPTPEPEPEVERTRPEFSNVLFDFDRSDLRPEGIEVIEEVIEELEEWPEDTVVIEGHTCNIGTAEYNMGLGQRRADSVRNYMVEQGIDPDRLSTVSYGLERPAVPNDTPANRALNRRVVFQYQLAD